MTFKPQGTGWPGIHRMTALGACLSVYSLVSTGEVCLSNVIVSSACHSKNMKVYGTYTTEIHSLTVPGASVLGRKLSWLHFDEDSFQT